ncbi:MAG: DUF4339 domain-containing protein [Planctomycetaceae bacterium]|nr:DUF4339 domain-containing protein [Planctomycetales bacterium]MCB9926482.1 DUF4339 domain-containing protein [Planctomycetaceae bacterium]
MNNWFRQQAGVAVGPFSFEELSFLASRGKLKPDDLVRCGERGAWNSASQVEGLLSARASQVTPLQTIERVVNERTVEAPQPLPAEHAAVEEVSRRREPPPAPPRPSEEVAQRRKALAGAIVAGAILILLLLLFLFRAGRGEGQGTVAGAGNGGQSGRGSGAGTGTGEGPGSKDAEGTGSGEQGSGQGDPRPSQEDTPQRPSGHKSADPKEPQPSALPKDEPIERVPPPEEDAPPSSVFRVQRFETPPAPADNAEEEGGSGGGSGGGMQTIGGVKVKGTIALVCDVSGSMAGDFPALVRELRRKFPRNTPLILIPGCNFAPPSPVAAEPQKLIETGMSMPYVGAEFVNDQHVYYGVNTTEAVIFAVEKLHRRTVVFNNDLQDGGSESAIDAFEELRKRRPFTLSGRSLNCEAPPQLLKFIKASGGDFKVDTIGRTRMPAVQWYP